MNLVFTDEMNLFAPQSIQAKVELLMLSNLLNNVISPKDSSPVISLVQDTPIGLYYLSQEKELKWNDVTLLLSTTSKLDEILNGEIEYEKRSYSGNELISLFLPDGMNLKFGDIEIKNGKIKEGSILTGDIFKGKKGNILHYLSTAYDNAIYIEFVDNMQRISNMYLYVFHGFTIGINDFRVDEKINDVLIKERFQKVFEVENLLTNVEDNKIIDRETYEQIAYRELDSIKTNQASYVKERLTEKNNMHVMASLAKSKGKDSNIGFTMTCLGQCAFEGKLVQYTTNSRTLPYFSKNDDTPASRGFIFNNYSSGLKVSEFFYHNLDGRQGIIDTAIKTGDTGYVQRKIIKAAEDIYVAYDNTLRNGVDEIVQFVYAGNGFDVVSLVETKCNLLRMNTKDLKKKYKEKKVLEYVLSLRSELLSIIFASNTDRRYIPEKFMIPFNLFHILSSCKSEKTSKYTATEIIDKIQKTLNPFDTKISAISNDDIMKYENINHYYLIMKFLLIDHLDLSKSHNKVYIDNVLEKIQYNIYKNIIQPGEMVGITSAQSIGEPLTQFTLNSVEWNTELLLKINGKLKVVKIGEWIDERIDNASKENLEYHKNDQTLEYIKDCKVEVLSADENGKVIWDNISAVTKHPVINKDKSRTLVKVTTDSGRVITATKGDSFLIRQNNKLMKYKGEDLKIGDYIPVANVFPSSNIKEWDFEEYIPKDEYVYMSEVNKALELKEKTKFWWSKHHNKDFVLPFKRGCTFYDACKTKYLNQSKKEYFQNKIYPKHGTMQSGHIPEKFELDNLFGFFLGAYLAEGHCTQYQVLISNCDNDFMDRIIMFCDQHSLKYHFDEGTRPKGYSRTIRIHSLILAQLFMKACGKTSDEKHVPTELLDANEDFLKGLMDGYISGDGCVRKNNHGGLFCTSISKSLLDDIQVILARFSIFSKIFPRENSQQYNLEKGLKARLSYDLVLSKSETIYFRNHFTLTVKNKQERLNEVISRDAYSMKDMIPDIETEQFGKITIQRKKLDSYIQKCNNQNDLQILENIKNENIKYDKIVNIEEVVSDHFYVYDVTADKTKNFCLRTMVAVQDTFHSTGSSSAVGGMDGIKRFLEIINITKNQKVPITTIYMTEEYRYEKKNAEILSKKLKYVKFEDLIESYDIIYDETKERMKQDKIVENTKLFLDKNIKASNINPYTFRMVISKESIYDENVELIDIKLAILKFFEECNLKITKKRYKTLFANLENVLILSNSAHDEEIIIHVRLKINEDVVDLETLKTIFDIFLKEIHIKGLPGIELVSFEDRKIHELDASENIVEKTEYVILTKGINLNELFLLHGIDKERTITNDIQITYRYYGIEAARQLFIKEIMKVFEMGGHSLNQHHLTIIGDLVTKNGILTSVNRYGLNKLDNDPLSKASFEQTMTELIKASIYEDKDYLRSVSSRIMTGKTIKGGTGLIDVILDIDKLQSINFDKSNYEDSEDIELVNNSDNDSDDESEKFVESDVFKNL